MIFITAIFVNNVVLSQFLGICPFLGVSKKVETAMGMGAAVAFVLTLATIVTYVIQKFVLDAFGLGYLQTIAFILVIAALVQMVEIILKKVSPSLYQALGVFLPLITTNCCILGAQDTIQVNARFFGGDISLVPKTALTVGVGTVLSAKKVLILATGHKKARAVRHGVEGSYNHQWTISALQVHPNGILVCDDPAAEELRVATYRYFKDIERENLISK